MRSKLRTEIEWLGALSLLLASAHFAVLFTVGAVSSLLLDDHKAFEDNRGTVLLRGIADVLLQPLNYEFERPNQLVYDFVLIPLNSLLWGCFAALVLWSMRSLWQRAHAK